MSPTHMPQKQVCCKDLEVQKAKAARVPEERGVPDTDHGADEIEARDNAKKGRTRENHHSIIVVKS